MLNTDRLCLGCMSDNGGEKVCPICGYDSATPNPKGSLRAGSWLNDRYLLGRVISADGEGITYIGWDNSNDTIVNIREFYPTNCAFRNPDYTVAIIPERKFDFNEGLLAFVELNRTLLNSELSAIVPIIATFEENGTAYSVSQVIQGITLEDFLTRNGGNLKWEQARPLFLPVIDTLASLHALGIIHGGISPETVFVGRDGKLRLGNISILKLRDASSSFSAKLFDGYSAAEQYGIPEMNIGISSDVYALSAVLFRVLIGTVPPVSNTRLENDSLSIPSRFAEELPRQVLVSLANGLQANPKNRTANIEAFKNELVYGETAEQERISSQKRNSQTAPVKKKKSSSGFKYVIISASVTAAIFIILAGALLWVLRDRIFTDTQAPTNSASDYVPDDSGPVLGEYDKDVVEAENGEPVPSVLKKYYSDIIDEEDYEMFKFEIQGKVYTDDYAKGTICAQNIAPGTKVEKDTTIYVTISLGPKEFKMPKLIGMTEEEAKIELLKHGFLYDNIDADGKMEDSSAPTGVVLEQYPEYNQIVTGEEEVKIYLNTYKHDEESNNSSDLD